MPIFYQPPDQSFGFDPGVYLPGNDYYDAPAMPPQDYFYPPSGASGASQPPPPEQAGGGGKAPPYQGPVARSPDYSAQPPAAGEGYAPAQGSLLDLDIFSPDGWPRSGPGPNYFDPIQGQITGMLMGQDPFPSELVPPFVVAPGMADEGFSGNPLFDPNQQGFDPAQGFSPEAVFGQGFTANAMFGQGYGASAGQANVNLDQFQATTRTVSPDELVSNQLQALLDEDSAYMQNARRRGAETAGRRGALSSSVFAEASQRAAIEAGVPIASADAQAFIQAASQNMQAQNQMTLAKLDSTTQQALTNAQLATQASIATAQNLTQASLENARLGTQTSISNAANLTEASLTNAQLGTQANIAGADNMTAASRTNADLSAARNNALIGAEVQRMITQSRENIAETQLNAQYSMMTAGFSHDRFIQEMLQDGRIDLQLLSGSQQAALVEAGFDHDIDIAELSHAQRIELENILTDTRYTPQLEVQRAQIGATVTTNILGLVSNMMIQAMGEGVDAAGAARAMEQARDLAALIPQILENVVAPGAFESYDDIFAGMSFP